MIYKLKMYTQYPGIWWKRHLTWGEFFKSICLTQRLSPEKKIHFQISPSSIWRFTEYCQINWHLIIFTGKTFHIFNFYFRNCCIKTSRELSNAFQYEEEQTKRVFESFWSGYALIVFIILKLLCNCFLLII